MSQNFVNVFDLSRKKTAVLQNAYNITETQELNKIYTLSFSIPSDDPKAEFCLPFHFVRYGETGQLYRIIGTSLDDSDTSILNVSCEHVIATLCDNVMFGSVQYGGSEITTPEVINFILSKQQTQNWVLDECDYSFQYEYNWEQENLLNALYSIPKEFTNAYKWTFVTTDYPWRISLKAIDENQKPEYYLRAKRNLLGSSTAKDFADVCTRLYPLGYGEGINQLTIKDVNDGIPYLEASLNVVAQYGIKEKVLVDRQFENAESLKAYAQTMLDNLQIPSMTRNFSVVDLYEITSTDIDNAEVGKICKLTGDGTITYITKTARVLDQAGNLSIALSTKTTDVADTIADLADRVRIESVYSQGATQLYQQSKDANATPSKGMTLSLYFPREMKQINKVLLRMQLKRFRSYSQTTESGGGSTSTSSGGSVSGSTSQATGSGGFSATSTGTSDPVWEGDGNAIISSASSNLEGYTTGTSNSSPYYVATATPNSTEFSNHGHYLYSPFPHSHTLAIPGYHPIFLRSDFSHSHKVSLSLSGSQTSHTHSFNIGSHTHSVSIPAHTHNIAAGIFESGNPNSFSIKVGGTVRATINATSYDDDITTWLVGNDGTIPRGQWINMEIIPNDNAYVVASVFVQGFVQSRGGGNY